MPTPALFETLKNCGLSLASESYIVLSRSRDCFVYNERAVFASCSACLLFHHVRIILLFNIPVKRRVSSQQRNSVLTLWYSRHSAPHSPVADLPLWLYNNACGESTTLWHLSHTVALISHSGESTTVLVAFSPQFSHNLSEIPD